MGLHLTYFRKLFWLVTVVVVIVFVFVGVMEYISIYNGYVRERTEDYLKQTIETANKAAQVFDYGREIARLISTQDDVKAFVENRAVSKQTVLAKLQHYNENGFFSAIYILDRSGLTRISTDVTFEGNDFSFRNYYKDALKGNYGIDAAVGIVSRRMGYYFAYPIYSANEATISGVAVAKMDPMRVEQVISAGTMAPISDLLLTNDDGVVLYSKDSARLYNSLGPLSQAQKDKEANTRFINRNIPTLSFPNVAQQIYQYSSPAVVEGYNTRHAIPEILAVAKTGQYPFFIVAETNKNDFLKVVSDQLWPIIADSVLGVILIEACLWLFLRRLTSPVRKLHKYLYKQSVGRDGNIHLNTSDEFEDIGKKVMELVKRSEKKTS